MLGDRLRVDALATRPGPARVEEVRIGLHPRPGQLHPPRPGRGGEDGFEAAGIGAPEPHEALRLLRRHALTAAGGHRIAHPVGRSIGRDGDARR